MNITRLAWWGEDAEFRFIARPHRMTRGCTSWMQHESGKEALEDLKDQILDGTGFKYIRNLRSMRNLAQLVNAV